MSAVALGAILTTLAFIWPGFDEQQTPIDTGSVWALQTGEGTRYARVNTNLGELDTVRSVENPSQLVQSEDRLLVYTQANATFADVNLATPANLDEPGAEALQRTPRGTVSVVSAGNYVVYLTETGQVFSSSMLTPESNPVELSLSNGETSKIDTIAAHSGGLLAAYSGASKTVVTVDLTTGQVLSTVTVARGPDASAQLTLLGETWILLSAEDEKLWSAERDEAVAITVTDQARIQRPSTDGDSVLVADATGLWRYRPGDDTAERVLRDAEIDGTPAAPIILNGASYAAWLQDGDSAGALWSSQDGLKGLSYASADIGEGPNPEFQVSGSRAILNDTKSGWVWRVPNGDLVASSQSWVSVETDTQAENPADERADRMVEPKPPVAVDDAFGVRVESQLTLQLLLNDSDPNEDVLSVVPGSLSGLPSEFGTLALGEHNQQVIVTVAASASGTATFSYRVTDGTSANGLESNVATVTLTVVPESTNRAPVWCGVEGCLATWPSPEVAPGQTVTTEVLAGWVDPDGDPVYLAGAKNEGDSGSVTFTPAGSVVFQHPDVNQTAESSASIALTVSDDRAATASKQLDIRITPNPTLTAKSFAVSGVTAQPLEVLPLEYVTGVSGLVQLTAVEVLDAQRSKATLNSNQSSFEFMANEPGSYLVRYTVRDALAERTGLVRVLIQKPETATFATLPLTVFVWPQADATVNLLSGVSNPTGRVLLVSNVQPSPNADASMSLDLVSQQYLRVSGSTSSGASGALGRVQYEVTDSSTSQRALGQVTVIAMPAPEPAAPIAVDDRITVRAGAQIDIPVLNNDSPAAGTTVTLDPGGVANSDSKSLAFASANVLRYLAPEKPGTFEVGYRIFTNGYPNLSDTATVTITVLGDEVNRKPQPRTLEARVLSGETVRIPFDAYGIDPDGDSVTLDRISTQPESGTASISADGKAIEYTSVANYQGQVSFEYQVRDSRNEFGTAAALVGVRDAQIDPRPVVFTDFVQVQAGGENTIVVEPLLNDISPTGEALKLTAVVPNAVKDSENFAELSQRIVSTESQRVTLRAGTTLGTSSYIYTVTTASGDSANGLVVVRTIRESVPDVPVVSDTVLDFETRQTFPSGVDVVKGKVSWATGDVSSLKLNLWNAASDLSVSGWKISGPLPKDTRVIPFEVVGINAEGTEVSSYGFLRVPGENDLRLALRANLPELKVNEGEKLEFDISKLIIAPRDTTIVVLESGVRASGVREDSSCTLTGSTTIRYAAGKGAPWQDSCTVPIRLETQNVYTYLTVPLSIEADQPQPELGPAAVTVNPGESLTYDLRQMVDWTGGEDWSGLKLAVAAGGSDFKTELNATTLTITASDQVKPGTQQAATVSVLSHKDVPESTLTIRAGPAPSTLPQGATVTQQCSQGDGASCEITVVGAAGEVNPLPNTALELVSVEQPNMCPSVTFEVSGAATVRASWTESTVGAQCSANFVVKDAQERQSLGDRVGSVTLDLQGFPQAASSVELKSFGDRTLALEVSPGAASNAYPALQGFTISQGGSEVSTCGPSGQDCTPITGLTNGEKVTFEVESINSVGRSKSDNPRITTWSYRVPTIDQVTATPVFGAQTDEDTGMVEVVIQTNDAEVQAFEVTGASGLVSRTGSRTTVTVALPTSTSVIEVTPLSAFEAPDGGSSSGAATAVGVSVAGSPIAGSLSLNAVSANSITVTALDADSVSNGSKKPIEIVYVAFRSGGSVSCSVDATGGSLSVRVTNGVQSSSTTLTGLQSNATYTVQACVSNGFGKAESTSFTAIPFAAPSAPSGYTYSIADGSTSGDYSAQISSAETPPTGFAVVYSGDTAFGTPLDITAKYCLVVNGQVDTTRCGAEATVEPAVASNTVQFKASSAALCQLGAPLDARVTATQGVAGSVSKVTYLDSSGVWQTLASPTDPIPEGTQQVKAEYTWTSTGTAGLKPFLVNCTPQ